MQFWGILGLCFLALLYARLDETDAEVQRQDAVSPRDAVRLLTWRDTVRPLPETHRQSCSSYLSMSIVQLSMVAQPLVGFDILFLRLAFIMNQSAAAMAPSSKKQ